MAVSVGPGPSFGVPKMLFQTRVPAGISASRTHYVPSPDGQRFLVNTQIGEAQQTPITVVLNWQAALKKQLHQHFGSNQATLGLLLGGRLHFHKNR